MKDIIFMGAGVAIVTPMNSDGSINYKAFARLIDFQLENETDAIIVCGTTGEGSTLSYEEHCQAIKFCVDYVAGRVPVVAGTGSNDTAFAIKLSQQACADGVDGLLVVTPYYNKASQRGLIKHFTAIADNVDKPMILYSVPSRTGVNIEPETCYELSKHQNIVAIKEASGNISQVAKINALCGDELAIYSGNDDQVVPIMSLGGLGVISVLSNVMPYPVHCIAQYCLEGNFIDAAIGARKVLKLANALFIDVNPIPVKEALCMLGLEAGPCRLPLCELDEVKRKKLRDVMQDYRLIGILK